MFLNCWKKYAFMPFLEGDGGSGGSGGTGGTGGDGGTEGGSNGGSEGEGGSEKTFTQEDLNRIAAQEKRQGMSSVLKALGFEKEEDAKAFVEKYRKKENDKKDDLTKANESLATEKKAKEEAEKKADLIEKKFKVVAKGVSADKAEDIVVLAMSKAINGKSFDDALDEVEKAYPTLFEDSGSEGGSGGTGGSGKPPRKRGAGGNSGGIGKRLAEQRLSNSDKNKKNSYFSN